MAELQSAFVEKSIACPACKKKHGQRNIRARMYVAGDRDSDRHVKQYKWIADNAEPVHPPYYHIHLCPWCFYADTVEDYAAPHNAYAQKAFRQAGENNQKIEVIELLAKHVDYETVDFESALNLHFLAIFNQMLVTPAQLDTRKIAGLLLRVAWLYREHAPNESGKRINPYEQEMLKTMVAYEALLLKAREAWATVCRTTSRHLMEIDETLIDGSENPLRSHQENIEKLMRAEFAELFRMKSYLRGGSDSDPNAGAVANKSYYGYPSHGAFMTELKTLWAFAPMDEQEAMRSAVEYYNRAIDAGAFSTQESFHSAISVITDLMVRCKDLDGAFKLVRSIHQEASDSRHRYQVRMKEENVDGRKRRQLREQIDRVDETIHHTNVLHQTLLDSSIESEKPKILHVLAEHADASLEQIEQALRQVGISSGMIKRMEERDDLLKGYVDAT